MPVLDDERREDRFYETPSLICALCQSLLEPMQRKAEPDSMKLVHPRNQCERSGRAYYCPGRGLTRIPKNFQ